MKRSSRRSISCITCRAYPRNSTPSFVKATPLRLRVNISNPTRRLQRRRQTRLGNMKPLRRLGDGTDLSHSDDVFQKLNGHNPTLANPQILTNSKPHPQSQTASRSPQQPQPQPAVGSITNPTHRHPVLRDRGCSPTPHNLRHRRPIQDSPMMEVTRPQNRIPHLHLRHK